LTERPQIKLPYRPVDIAPEALVVLLLVANFVIVFYYYRQLPAEIAIHFNLKNEPDNFGGKGSIWILPILNLILSAGMLALARVPQLHNYPTTLTAENAPRLYRLSAQLLRWVALSVAIIFLWGTWEIISFSLREGDFGLSIGAVFALIFLPLVIYFIKFKRIK